MGIEDLRNRCAEAARLVKSLPAAARVACWSHYDTDGLTAAGVVSLALARAKRRFRMAISRDQGPEFFRSIGKRNPEAIVVSDFGSGAVDILESYRVPTVILDHHVPQKDGTDGVLVHANALLLGVNGTTEASASTVAFGFALGLDEANWDLAGIALTGAYGDRQHVPEFRGWNGWVLEEARRRGVVAERPGPRLPEVPLVEALSESIDPYFRGFGTEKGAVQSFLKGLKIDPAKRLGDLPPEQREKLASALAVQLMKQGSLDDAIKEFLGPRLHVTRHGLSMAELSDLLNACGREDAPDEGVSLLLGDREALGRAREMVQRFRRKVLEALVALERKPPRELDAIRVFEGGEPQYVGMACGLGMVHFFPKDKPTLGYARDGPELKFSGRGTAGLIARGLNLAAAMQEAAARVGGHGGGHPVASGATVPAAKLDEFLGAVDAIVARQVSRDR